MGAWTTPCKPTVALPCGSRLNEPSAMRGSPDPAHVRDRGSPESPTDPPHPGDLRSATAAGSETRAQSFNRVPDGPRVDVAETPETRGPMATRLNDNPSRERYNRESGLAVNPQQTASAQARSARCPRSQGHAARPRHRRGLVAERQSAEDHMAGDLHRPPGEFRNAMAWKNGCAA